MNTDHIEETDPTAERDRKRSMYKTPFPLDGGDVAYLYLPMDLTRHEADRLMAMIDTLPLPKKTS